MDQAALMDYHSAHPLSDPEQDCDDAATSLRGAKVLLVEDNRFNQELTIEVLTAHDVTADLATNGQEALDMIRQNDYDGILMDCQMPVMDGFTATQKIRALKGYESLPVIAMSANVMDDDAQRALDVGMNDHIPKPVNVRDMLDTMSKWIRPSRPAAHTTGTTGAANPSGAALMEMPRSNHIDNEAGLARLAGDGTLYVKLLKKFAAHQGQAVQQIRDALRAANLETATRIAHSLKGTAGNIGAHGLQTLSAEVEQRVKSGDAPDATALERLESVLNEVTGAIRALQPAGVENRREQLAEEGLIRELEDLHQMMLNFDSQSEDRVAELIEQVGDPDIKSRLQTVAGHLACYDFEQALKAFSVPGLAFPAPVPEQP